MGVGGDDGGQASGREALASRIAWQLAQHGAVAGTDSGDAFHLIEPVSGPVPAAERHRLHTRQWRPAGPH